MSFQILTQLQFSLSTAHFLIGFLLQHLGLSIFDPNLGWNNPAFFRVCIYRVTIQYTMYNCDVYIELLIFQIN